MTPDLVQAFRSVDTGISALKRAQDAYRQALKDEFNSKVRRDIEYRKLVQLLVKQIDPETGKKHSKKSAEEALEVDEAWLAEQRRHMEVVDQKVGAEQMLELARHHLRYMHTMAEVQLPVHAGAAA
jgi:hypothetical protein